jgi:hypothetical protein
VWIAWLLWLLSLMLPAVAVGGVMPGAGGFAMPGWQTAIICALNPAEAVGKARQLHAVITFLVRLMALTNVLPAIAPAVLFTRRRAPQAALCVLAFAAVCIDLVALQWFHAILSIGYAVWLASFVLLALTLRQERAC